MRNLKVTMAYKGTAYHGYQRQNNANSIQQTVEDTLSVLLGEKVTINGDKAIVITLSSKLSGTYSSAKKASENYNGNMKNSTFAVGSCFNSAVSKRLRFVDFFGRTEYEENKITTLVILAFLGRTHHLSTKSKSC